ncbi:MAG: hypothetical protein V1934_03860 [Methanobacteriota archaeon]
MNYARLLALCLTVAMVFSGAVSMSPSVKAADTTSQWFSVIPGAPGVEFRDAEWAPGGSHALFVGYDSGPGRGSAWWYNPLDESWYDITLTNGSSDGLELETVEFWNDCMVAMGDCGPAGTWFYTNKTNNLLEAKTDFALVGAYIYDLMYIGGTMFAFGQNTTAGYAMCWYNNGTGWQHSWGAPSHASSVYYGADWYAYGPNVSIFMVGSWDDAGTTRGLYQEYNVTPMNITTISDTFELEFTDIELDASNATYPRMLITAGGRGAGMAALFVAKSIGGLAFHNLVGIGDIPLITNLMGIDVDEHGTAVAVGIESAYGVIYSIYRAGGSTVVMKRSDTSTMFSGKVFRDVRIRPFGVQMALTVGSAFKYSYTSILSPIRVDASTPHISYITMWPISDPSKEVLNHQIDVDDGSSATQYTLSVCIWDNLGIDHVTAMNIWMWYDMGLTGVDAPAVFDDADLANQRIRFSISNGAGGGAPIPALRRDDPGWRRVGGVRHLRLGEHHILPARAGPVGRQRHGNLEPGRHDGLAVRRRHERRLEPRGPERQLRFRPA